MTDGTADILIVEDEKSVRDALVFALKDKYGVHLASDGKKGLDTVAKGNIDLVLLDINLPEINGMDLLGKIKELDASMPVIMITGNKTVSSAVSAMKLGAYDYIVKPFDIKELTALIERALEKKMLEQQNLYLRAELERSAGFEKIIGRSAKMKEIFNLIRTVAKSDSTVLISGESGTGKELVARAIHNQSARSKKLFIAVNCAAIPENLLESELFGYEKGAFTGAMERRLGKFELSDGGTIFLDEIGSMPLSMQSKILRALQERVIDRVGGTSQIPVNVRVISATNSDLKAEIENRKFRNDLYYRLNVIPIHLPPLRERTEDIPLLIKYFLEKYKSECAKKISDVSKPAMDALIAYKWPGNVRELENLIERLVVLCVKSSITEDMLPQEIYKGGSLTDKMEDASKKFELGFVNEVIRNTNLNERQMKAIDHVRTEGKITKQGYIKLTNSPKTTAFRDLSALVKLNILAQNGTGKSSFYTLSK